MRNLADSLSSRRISTTFARALCALIISSVAIASRAFADGNSATFNYTGTIQTFTVPENGYYSISATGAVGGGSQSSPGWVGSSGGAGARAAGIVHLTSGTVL